MTNFVRIVNATGVIDGWGSIPATQIPLQARDGMTVLECSEDTVQRDIVDNRTVITVGLAWLKEALRSLVDSNAQSIRSVFITDIAGQSQIYEKKSVEAAMWFAGDETQNPDKYPFMIAEAAALDISIADLAAQIKSRVSYLTPIMAEIEAKRISAKSRISDSQTIQQAIAASQIDFDYSRYIHPMI